MAGKLAEALVRAGVVAADAYAVEDELGLRADNATNVTATTNGDGGIAKGIAPSGTIAADGTITLGTALPAVFTGGIWLYVPAGAVVGGDAGFIYCVMSSSTVGTAYAAPSGSPVIGSGSAYTGVTSEITVATQKIKVDEVSGGRRALVRAQGVTTNAAGTSTYRLRIGATQAIAVGVTNQNGFRVTAHVVNLGGSVCLTTDVGGSSGTSNTLITSAGAGSELVVNHTLQMDSATKYMILADAFLMAA